MISVVIPLYNKERSIVSTIESVLSQTNKDWELIIVDDGSTDNSLNIVKEFIERIDNRWISDRFTIISQPNTGVSAARNAGIMAANSEYVAFLDADDLWAPNYLETLAILIQDYPNAGLYSLGSIYIYTDTIPQNLAMKETAYKGVIASPWDGNYQRLMTSSSSSSRDRLIKVGLFDTRMSYGEDLDMWWRLILDGGLAVDTTCCAFYRLNTENRAMNKPIPLKKHIPYYMDKYSEARAKNANFRRYFDMQMVYRLYPYMFDKQYRKDARRIAKKLDYRQLKVTMLLRLLFPHLYRLFTGR